MRRLLFVTSLVAMSVGQVHAVDNAGYAIKTTFEYDHYNFPSKDVSIAGENGKVWTALVEPVQGVALLGRFTSRPGDSVNVDFLIVDTNKKAGTVPAARMIVLLGEPASIAIGGPEQTLKIKIQIDKK